MPTFAATKDGYRKLWQSMKITRQSAVSATATKILGLKAHYQKVEAITNVPWYWIAVAHMRESGNNFAGVLHNGEHIIGTGQRTRLVPAGRGPFSTWEEAAVDAIRLKGLHTIKDWSLERVAYELERFNGWGYFSKGVTSPYLWSGSNHYKSGKYVRDHVYDPSAVDNQLGVMPVLKELASRDDEVARRLRTPTQVSKDVGDVVVGGGTVAVAAYNFGPIVALIFAAAVAAFVIYRIIKRRK